jgi:hypothetical protein
MASCSELGQRMGLLKLLIVLFALSNLFLFISHSNDGVDLFGARFYKVGRRTQIEVTEYPTSDVYAIADFSSCLIVPKQDADKLSEWLAYHFYALETRYVVVLPDPEVDGTVSDVLDKWKSVLNIVSWSEKNLFDAKDTRRTVSRRGHEDEAAYQGRREASFYHNCAAHMQRNGRTIVSFQKVNEFATINVDAVTNANTLMKEPSALVRVLEYAQATQIVADSSCTSTYRTAFSTAQSTVDEIQAHMPELLQGQLPLSTLQFGVHDGTNNPIPPTMGTAFVNVAALPADRKALSVTQYGTIRGRFEFAPFCPTPAVAAATATSAPDQQSTPPAIFRMHVYPSSSAAVVVAAVDTANSTEAATSSAQAVQNDSVAPWIKGFVQQVGAEQAALLLLPGQPEVAAAVESN